MVIKGHMSPWPLKRAGLGEKGAAHSDSKHQKNGNKYFESRYGRILYQNYVFLGQGIHFRGLFLSKSGHDHYGGHG